MNIDFLVLESLKLKDLYTFVVVADSASFSEAAQKLLTAQPSLSRKIHSIENRLGQELFVRNKGGLPLTDAGKKFYEYARRVLGESASLSASLSLSAAQTDQLLRIGHSFFTLPGFYFSAIDNYGKEYPQSRFDIMHCEGDQECTRKVLNNELDVGLVSLPPKRAANLQYQKLERQRCHAIIKPCSRYAGAAELSLAELTQETLFVPAPSLAPAHAHIVKELMAGTGLEYRVEYEENLEKLLFSIRCGFGIGILTGNSVAHEECGLVTIPIKEDVQPRHHAAVWRKGIQQPNITAFIQMLKKQYRQSDFFSP